jgi:three-Cys-motif partner protein
MAASSDDWVIQPHTVAKHALLSAYLGAWFPILSLGGFERVIYIDGFAGPGRYAGGQDGSPILALRALASQPIARRSTFEFHFVERDRQFASMLETNLEQFYASSGRPARAEVTVHGGAAFTEVYDRVLRPCLLQCSRAPAFALIDPFGWTGIPMTVIADLIRRASTEVLVNFMFEEINRFLSHRDQPNNFDSLFGGPDWRAALASNGAERHRAIHAYYRDQLHRVGEAKYVRSFEMRNARDAIDYFLFFATNNLLGLTKMKGAMWKVDPSAGVSFSDATDPDQATLFQPEPDRGQLRRLILGRFAGCQVRLKAIETFVVESTPFLPSHYKRVLAQLEADGEIMVIDTRDGRRRGTFPDQTMALQFR